MKKESNKIRWHLPRAPKLSNGILVDPLAESLSKILENAQNLCRRQAAFVWNEFAKENAIEYSDCEICKEKSVHAHHDNYYEPLKVMFLCSACHVKRHKVAEIIQIHYDDIKRLSLTEILHLNKESYVKLLQLCAEKSSYGSNIK